MFGKKKEAVVVTEIKEITRFSREEYEKFEKAVGYISVNKDTTPTETAYMLGIQLVLKKLRDGYVSGS